MTIGDRIRAARERRKLTQAQLAEAVGVNATAVVHWENKRNTREITRKNLQKVAEVLGLSASELLGEHESMMSAMRPAAATLSVNPAEKTLLDLFRSFPKELQLLQLTNFVECAKLRKVHHFAGNESCDGLPETTTGNSQPA